jgi:hypothetical protein
MKFLLLIMFLIGVAYAWFSFYEPRPSSGTMQGTMQQFQEAIMAHDVAGMRRLCATEAMDDCDSLMERIREAEAEDGALATVGSLGFDYTRNRTRVDGMVSGSTADGDTLFNVTVAVEERGDTWQVVVIN